MKQFTEAELADLLAEAEKRGAARMANVFLRIDDTGRVCERDVPGLCLQQLVKNFGILDQIKPLKADQ